MVEHKLRKLFADQCFSKLVVVEQEEWTQALPETYQEKPQVRSEKTANRA